ncbi:MAG: hypothetical protein SCALA702_00760 [Melioribacteraceae bacterium]|nr:MAG: hypothetical protein SCALA702_00760 [Melioribacteraceae bacterium]
MIGYISQENIMNPKIFVSSTIIDFEDLRSALKFYLEEYGYDVQMSEYPNFNIDPNKSLFDTCVSNLISCDYFIQLIGYRRGSWYQKGEISITHLEYRAAKYLIEAGHQIRIISFVRKPIWLLREDRDALSKHFIAKSNEISEEIKNTGTNIIDDPSYIFSFISEISQGIKFPGSQNPANNWIFDFQHFEDIVTALKHTFNFTETLSEKRLKSLLKKEMKINKEKFSLLEKNSKDSKKTDVFSKVNMYECIARDYYPKLFSSDGTPTIDIDGIEISGNEVGRLMFYGVLYPLQKGLKKVETVVLEKVIYEGIFLKFNIKKNDFESTLFVSALEKLLEWLKIYNNLYSTDFYDIFHKEITSLSTDGSAHKDSVRLSMHATGFILGMSNSVRIYELLNILEKVIDNGEFDLLLEFDFSDKFYMKYLKEI